MIMMRGRKVPLSEAVANLLPLGLKATAARLVMRTYLMQYLSHSLCSSSICLRARIVAPLEKFVIPGVVSRDHHLRLQVKCVKELNLQRVCDLRCLFMFRQYLTSPVVVDPG